MILHRISTTVENENRLYLGEENSEDSFSDLGGILSVFHALF